MAPLPCLSVPAASPHLSVPGQSRRRLAGFRASRHAEERGSTTGPVNRPPTASKRISLQSSLERPIYLSRYWQTDWAASLCHPPETTLQTTPQHPPTRPSPAPP